jgi:hypothetical protein
LRRAEERSYRPLGKLHRSAQREAATLCCGAMRCGSIAKPS